MRSRFLITTGLVTFVGAILLVLGFLNSGPTRVDSVDPLHQSANASQMQKTVGETPWKDVHLYEKSNPVPSVLISLGIALVSVFLIEVITTAGIQYFRGRNEKDFEEFFGKGSLSRSQRGRIILQADRFEGLIMGLTGKNSETTNAVLEALKRSEHNRLYKARSLLNARDAESAKIVREDLRRQRFPTPELDIIQRSLPGEEAKHIFDQFSEAPYLISMGLGFTETTLALLQDVANKCVYVDPATKHGDALVIDKDYLVPPYADLEIEKTPEAPDTAVMGKGYYRIFPRDWDVGKWLGDEAKTRDYAVIVRHTAVVEDRTQIRFVLAGFTEDGTVEAGRYLVSQWRSALWDLYKHKKNEGNGDFVVVISGVPKGEKPWKKEDAPIKLFGKNLKGA
jgi:hypothetical protein